MLYRMGKDMLFGRPGTRPTGHRDVHRDPSSRSRSDNDDGQEPGEKRRISPGPCRETLQPTVLPPPWPNYARQPQSTLHEPTGDIQPIVLSLSSWGPAANGSARTPLPHARKPQEGQEP